MPDRDILPQEVRSVFFRSTDSAHSFQLLRSPRFVVEIDDVLFHFDSPVLLPEPPPEEERSAAPELESDDEPRVTAMAVLATCLREAAANPSRVLLVTGHTDTKGAGSYNLQLSQERADGVFAALTGDKPAWVRIAQRHHRVDDYQRILHWLARDWGWEECEPGPINNTHNQATRAAVKAFKRKYGEEFGAPLPDTDTVDAKTWEAFFDCYMLELTELLEVDDAGLAELRTKLQFIDDQHQRVGCGESWPLEVPVKQEFRSVSDRRIELSFFESTERPLMECHPRPGTCQARFCQVYEPRLYEAHIIPVAPVFPRQVRVRIHLQLQWRDPNDLLHPFPEGVQVDFEYEVGATDTRRTDATGLLQWVTSRRRRSFTLRIKPGASRYFVSSRPGDAAHEELLPESEVAAAARSGKRIFKVPESFTIAETDWEAPSVSSYADPRFNLQTSTDPFGTPSAPIQFTLKPHWQYFKLQYFDRRLKQKLSVPPMVFEGFVNKDTATTSPPDTRSNWMREPEACHCLPWIIQKHADGTAAAKPDNEVQLQLRTAQKTWIDSSVATRRLLTQPNPPTGSSDPGLNFGEATAINFSTANGQRLSYYDLPPLFQARDYWAQLGAEGSSAARAELFQTLAAEPTSPTRPLLFSLDDIVLCDLNLNPLPWDPSTMDVAIFSNTFLNGTSTAHIGPYKPDNGHGPGGMNRSYFSKKEGRLRTALNLTHIVDYPDWTRLVLMGGNAFDVFDLRVPPRDGQPVGARAGVRWFDSAGLGTPGSSVARPAAAPFGHFSILQPFAEQLHDKYWTATASDDDRQIGRCDLLLLRCCDVGGDGVTEEAIFLTYLRLWFNFNPTWEANGHEGHCAPLALTGAAAANWTDAALRNIPARWTGPDGLMNPGPSYLTPQDAAAHPLRVRAAWFTQDVPRSLAHFELGIFKPKVATDSVIRAYMASSDGLGVLGDPGVGTSPDNRPIPGDGWFTSAHECGHGGTLNDEYIEGTTKSGMPSFEDYIPGSPFGGDGDAMMNSNRRPRPRHFWHLAEWLRIRYGFPFQVEHGGYRYSLPPHPQAPKRNYIQFPMRRSNNAEHGAHGKFDVLFYPLGHENFSDQLLPFQHTPSVAPYNGLLIVEVKMKFDFDTSDQAKINAALSGYSNQINFRMNNRRMVCGTVDGRSYDRILLYFSPRYWANGDKAPLLTDRHFLISVKDSGDVEWDGTIFGWGDAKHHLHFPINQPDHVFARFFRHMCGLPDSLADAHSDYEPITRKVIPDATVVPIS